MKTIYKSIALEAALLSVTLALRAEIQSEGETVTADVQANTLDRLKVTLVSPNVSGARDLIASGNAVIDGSEIAVNLENLAFGTHRLVVSARFGTQIRTLYALDISVPQAELPNETQEYEDAAIVVSTYGDGGGGGEFPTDYAKQGDDPTATLTDTQAYAQAAAEAAQSLIAVDADIFAGKQALATNISAKGVPTAVADALTTMATKVLQIPQQVNTRTSEFEQMIAPSPYMWNVYTVATDLMKQELPEYIPSYMAGGDYAQYRANNAFFVAEYYRGHDSLELTGADGYLTHDGCFYRIANGVVTRTAPDGSVTTYEATSIVHTWLNVAGDGYMNRWVAYMYLTNEYSYACQQEALCPRRVAICGSCVSFIISSANRLTDIWVVGTLGNLQGGTTGTTWNPIQVVRNYRDHVTGVMYANVYLTSLVLPDLKRLTGNLFTVATSTNQSYGADTISLPALTELNNAICVVGQGNLSKSPRLVYADALERVTYPVIGTRGQGSFSASTLELVHMANLEEIDIASAIGVYSDARGLLSFYSNECNNLKELYIPSLKRITRGWLLHSYSNQKNCYQSLIDVTVGAMETNLDLRHWTGTLVISDADKTATLIANIRNHILARVSDRSQDTFLTFTVSVDMYNAITAADADLGEDFLAKGWYLAGA